MANRRLTQRLIDNLKPGKSVREVRDTELRGFGVRILPSGRRRYFVHAQNNGQRVWTAIGAAATMPVAEARASARSHLAAFRKGEPFRTVEVSAGNPVRGRRGGCFPPLCPKLEAGHACGQSRVPEEPDPSTVPGTADRRHHGQGSPAMVRLPPLHSRRRRPGDAGPVGDHAGSRKPRIPPGRKQSVPEHPAVPAPWPRTVPLPGGNQQARHGAGKA